MGSLNVRIARNALESVNKTGPSFVALKNRFDKLLQQQPALKSYNRKIMTDDEVKNYIQKNIYICIQVRAMQRCNLRPTRRKSAKGC